MSRTYKDRPGEVRFGTWNQDMVLVDFHWHYLPTTKPKKRKEENTEWDWLGSTPSYWTHIMMNRPMRAKGRSWEHTVHREIDLEDTDPPGVGKKPHIYYW